MKQCCDHKEPDLVRLREQQGRVLWIVLGINSIMFLVELVAGIMGRSTALLADSLDMFGDASVYGFSLFALDRGSTWRNRAAILKGGIMAAFGIGVLAEAVMKALIGTIPNGNTMGVIGVIALMANLLCVLLLVRHRNDDLNMRSTWLCSRNDIIANLGVLVAAGLVLAVNSNWPDILIGSAIALLFLTSAIGVLRASLATVSEPNAFLT